jgi:hypothetical protein
MADAATTEVVRERDRALQRLRILASEIRAHEETMRGNLASRIRPADERLYRSLRQVNDGDLDQGDTAGPGNGGDANSVELQIRKRLYAPQASWRRSRRRS